MRLRAVCARRRDSLSDTIFARAGHVNKFFVGNAIFFVRPQGTGIFGRQTQGLVPGGGVYRYHYVTYTLLSQSYMFGPFRPVPVIF